MGGSREGILIVVAADVSPSEYDGADSRRLLHRKLPAAVQAATRDMEKFSGLESQFPFPVSSGFQASGFFRPAPNAPARARDGWRSRTESGVHPMAMGMFEAYYF